MIKHIQYPIHITVLIIILQTICLVQPVKAQEITPLPPVTEADGRMGTCYTFYEESLVKQAYAAGSRWDRFDFRWNIIEDQPGTFNFSGHDSIVNLDQEHDIQVVGILGSTAAWATTDCRTNTTHSLNRLGVPGHPPLQIMDDLWWRACPPDSLNLPWDHPDNAWGNFVYQTVSHFKDRVHTWEIWNEPDLGQVFWTGTPTEYAQLLKVGYQAVKAADPEATVLFAGLAYWSDTNFYVEVLDALQSFEEAADDNYYFDVMSLHLYSSVYNIRPVVNQITEAMNERVGPHPIWLTETGVPLWDEHPGNPGKPYVFAATIEEAAAYTIEAYAEARAAGVEKFFFFRIHDEAMSESFGLIRNDGSLRPAYVAYQVAARYLRHKSEILPPHQTVSGTRQITFLGTTHGRIDVLWNTRGENTLSHALPAILPVAKLVDYQGQTKTLHAQNDTFTVTLKPATANNSPDHSYFIGGPPVLLIQEDTDPPTSTLHPLAHGIYTDAITLTWDVTDTLAGYWYQEIEIGPTPEGPWKQVAGQKQTKAVTQTTITMPPLESYYQPWYFRSRARDRVGNWEAWPAVAETGTDFPLTRTVALSVTAYGKTEGTLTIKLPVRDVSMKWEGPGGAYIADTITSSWQVTQTVYVGEHTLYLNHPEYAPNIIHFGVIPGSGVQRLVFKPDFYEPRWTYLPLVFRNFEHP